MKSIGRSDWQLAGRCADSTRSYLKWTGSVPQRIVDTGLPRLIPQGIELIVHRRLQRFVWIEVARRRSVKVGWSQIADALGRFASRFCR
jgi:hypothetical protein